MTGNINILIFLILLGLSGLTPDHKVYAALDTGAGGGGGGGSTIASQTCDTQVWQTMEARAKLETEREIMQNQNLIFKPDSILNYTCFDNFAAHASANVGVLFTHTTYFGGAEIIPWGAPYGMDNAMDNVVTNSLQSYITSNFRHDYLGGRGGAIGLSTDNIPKLVGSRGRSYSCNVMNQVWQKAKCMNFIHSTSFAATDGFYPFVTLQASTGGSNVAGYDSVNDVRAFPTSCDGTPVTGSTWTDMYRRSRNETSFGDVDKLYQFGTPLKRTFTEVRDLLKPGSCGTAPAIKTGVRVILSPASSTSYDDGICTNPGCTYDKGGTCK